METYPKIFLPTLWINVQVIRADDEVSNDILRYAIDLVITELGGSWLNS